MSQIETIRAMLNELKLPQRQQNDMCCMVLMALAGISNQRKWENATNEWLRIHDLLLKAVVSGERVTADVVKQTLHVDLHFQRGIPELQHKDF